MGRRRFCRARLRWIILPRLNGELMRYELDDQGKLIGRASLRGSQSPPPIPASRTRPTIRVEAGLAIPPILWQKVTGSGSDITAQLWEEFLRPADSDFPMFDKAVEVQ
jgi:hypothetical protein